MTPAEGSAIGSAEAAVQGEAGLQSAATRSTAAELLRGWPPLMAAVIGVFASVQIVFFFANGLLIPEIAREFGWTRTQLSIPATTMALVGAFGAPLCGLLVDRFGVIWVAIPSMLSSAAVYWLLGRISSDLLTFLLLTCLLAVVGIGTSVVAYVSLVGRTFAAARGLAIGITMAATGLSGAVMPGIVTYALALSGWRGAYEALAVLTAGAAMLSWLFLVIASPIMATRVIESPTPAEGSGPSLQWGMTLSQARRTGAFWRLAVSLFLLTSAISGVLVHFVPSLVEAGITPAAAAATASMLGLAVIAGRLIAGVILDRIFAPLVACAFVVMAAAGCAMLAVDSAAYGPAGAVLIGLAMGAEVDVAGYAVGRYFGLACYASVYGWIHGIFTAGGIISPLLIGGLFDLTGSYRTGLALASLLLLITVPLLARMGRYPEVKRGA